MFLRIRRTDYNLLILNLLSLMGIVLFPFGTALFVEHLGQPEARTAALVYYGILTATAGNQAQKLYEFLGGIEAGGVPNELAYW
jgi:uncharacterized membrane protein